MPDTLDTREAFRAASPYFGWALCPVAKVTDDNGNEPRTSRNSSINDWTQASGQVVDEQSQ